MASITGMKGGGFYDAHSSPQRQALAPYVGWLGAALDRMELPRASGAPVRLLDIGSSEGANAIYAQNRIVEALRARTSQPIQPILSDLPTSDYNQLVSNLFPPDKAAFPHPEVFPALAVGSAYGRLVPSRSVHVVTSFNMLGWLSRRPSGGLPNYVVAIDPSPYAVGADYALRADETREFEAQAAADLATFYRARAAEMASGGLLLVQSFGTGEVHSTAHGIADAFHDTLGHLVAAGLVPEAVRREFFLPAIYRKLDALLGPLQEDPELAADFEVERAETLESPVSFNQSLAKDGDTAAWATEYAGFVRAFSETSLEAVVERQGESRDLVDLVYRTLQDLLRQDPERYRLRFISVGALLRRT